MTVSNALATPGGAPFAVNQPSRRPQSRHLVQSIRLEEQGASRFMVAGVFVISALIVAAIIWASVTTVQEVAHTEGEVIPAGRTHAIQHLEGGIVEAVAVSDGEVVAAGDLLFRLSPAASASDLQQMLARQAALSLQGERLRAFAEDRVPDFDTVVAGYADLKRDQTVLFTSMLENRESQATVLSAQIEQRQSELAMYERQSEAVGAEIAILEEELSIRGQLMERGLSSRIVYLNTQRDLARARGEMSDALENIARTQGAIVEATQRLAELDTRMRNDALSELGVASAELAEVDQAILSLEDRVERLDIRAPVRGIVDKVEVNTIGAVIAPGQALLEIVPIGEELRVEARVDPRDIGHIAVGQTASVRISSYDYARFGTVDGTVEYLSATTYLDEQQLPYYRALIALEQDYVGDQPGRNRIIPGMTLQADIQTGEKTVLDYLLRPVYRGLDQAFTER